MYTEDELSHPSSSLVEVESPDHEANLVHSPEYDHKYLFSNLIISKYGPPTGIVYLAIEQQ